MANQQAERDENFVPTLLGVSSVDGVSTVKIYADPVSHRLLVDTVAFTGTAAPNTTPSAVGQTYVDTNAGKVYISVGTSSSSDWAPMN